MSRSKKHHFIPQSVLKEFRSDDDTFCRRIRNGKGEIETEENLRNTGNTAQIRHLNSFRKNSKSSYHDDFEQRFNAIDDGIARVIAKLRTSDASTLDANDWLALKLYASTLVNRHPLVVLHQQQGILDGEKRIQKNISQHLLKHESEEEAYRRVVWMATVHMESAAKMNMESGIRLVHNKTGTDFIVSDAYIQPEGHQWRALTDHLPITKHYSIQLDKHTLGRNDTEISVASTEYLERWNGFMNACWNSVAIASDSQSLQESHPRDLYFDQHQNMNMAVDDRNCLVPILQGETTPARTIHICGPTMGSSVMIMPST
ncbi:DUF4238 domain-containing protein [Gammaproteobacteria bacterium]|nr:DUF4238 domain-containing protein [Gammaproteobacteria bacterium]